MIQLIIDLVTPILVDFGASAADVSSYLTSLSTYIYVILGSLLAMIVVMFAARFVKKGSRHVIRWTAAIAWVLVVLLVVNLVCYGPMNSIVSGFLNASKAEMSDDVVGNSKNVISQVGDEGMVLVKNNGLLPLVSDANKLNDLLAKIDGYSIYTNDEVENFNKIFFTDDDRTKLDPILDEVVERFKALDDNGKIDCKSAIKNYCRVYPFIAAVLPYTSAYWEKCYNFLYLLAHKLPKLPKEDWAEGLIEAVNFDQYRSIKQGEAQFEIHNQDSEIDPIPVGSGGFKPEPDFDKLTNILEEFNATYGGINWEHPEEAINQIKTLPDRLAATESFANAVKRSDPQNAEIESNNALQVIVMSLLDEKTEFARNYFENPQFQAFINERVFQQACSKVAKQ